MIIGLNSSCIHSAGCINEAKNYNIENKDWGIQKLIVGHNNGMV